MHTWNFRAPPMRGLDGGTGIMRVREHNTERERERETEVHHGPFEMEYNQHSKILMHRQP